MKKAKITAVFCAAVVMVLCVAERVPANTVEIGRTGYGAKDVIKIWGGGHNGLRVYAGVYMFNQPGGSGEGNLWPDGPLGVFCLEIHEWAPSCPLTYDVVMVEDAQKPTDFLGGPIGSEKAGYLSELWGRFFDPDWVGDGPFTCQQKKYAEAFSAAVWEIVYEDLPASPLMWDVTVDGTAGKLGFRCKNADTATANNWLHALDGTGPKADLRALVYDGKQDYIVEVPEPATVCLLGLGVLSLLWRRRA